MRKIKSEDEQERVEVSEDGSEHFYRKVYFNPPQADQFSLLLMYSKPARKCTDGSCKTCG